MSLVLLLPLLSGHRGGKIGNGLTMTWRHEKTSGQSSVKLPKWGCPLLRHVLHHGLPPTKLTLSKKGKIENRFRHLGDPPPVSDQFPNFYSIKQRSQMRCATKMSLFFFRDCFGTSPYPACVRCPCVVQ